MAVLKALGEKLGKGPFIFKSVEGGLTPAFRRYNPWPDPIG
jgi:hypothetical protein